MPKARGAFNIARRPPSRVYELTFMKKACKKEPRILACSPRSDIINNGATAVEDIGGEIRHLSRTLLIPFRIVNYMLSSTETARDATPDVMMAE